MTQFCELLRGFMLAFRTLSLHTLHSLCLMRLSYAPQTVIGVAKYKCRCAIT